MANRINTQRLIVAVVAFVAALATIQAPALAADNCSSGACRNIAATWVPGMPGTTTSVTSWQKNVSSYELTTKKIVVVNYGRAVRKRGRCVAVGSGTAHKWFWNSYKRASNGARVWFKDSRRSTICNGKRTACQNPARLSRPRSGKIVLKKNVRIFTSITKVKSYFSQQGSSSSTTTTTGPGHYVCPEGVYVGGGMCRVCPPPVCPPPPPTAQPPSVTVNQPQEVYVRETYPNLCASVTAPAGHSLTVRFNAQYGVGFTRQVTSVGVTSVCGSYTAPTEVPPGGSDTVTVVAYDAATGLSGSGAVTFPIMAAPPNP